MSDNNNKTMGSIESRDLAVHVAVCHERYKTLFSSIRRLEAVIIAGTGATIVFMGAMVWQLVKLVALSGG